MKYTRKSWPFIPFQKSKSNTMMKRKHTVVLMTAVSSATIMENYDYYEYEDYDAAKKDRVPRSAIEWFDARTRYRRDTDDSSKSEDTVTYEVTVRLVKMTIMFASHKGCRPLLEWVTKSDQHLTLPVSISLCVVTTKAGISQEWPLLTSHF